MSYHDDMMYLRHIYDATVQIERSRYENYKFRLLEP